MIGTRDFDTGAWTSRLVVGLLAVGLVLLHLIVDDTCYDVAQVPRLRGLLVALMVLLPLALLTPIGRRLDASILRTPVVLTAAAYLGITACSLAWAVNVTAGFTDLFRTGAAFLVLCLACLLLPTDARWQERLLEAAAVGAAVAAGIGLLQAIVQLGGGWPSRRAMEAVTGLQSNVNLYAGYLLLLLPWCGCGAIVLRGGWRITATIAALALVGTILLVQSRAAWLGLAASAGVTGCVAVTHARLLGLSDSVRRGILGLFATGLAAAVAVGSATGSDTAIGRTLEQLLVARPHQAAGPTDGGRTMIWGITARMIADHPLAGVGAGNFTVRLHEYYGGGGLDFTNLSSDNWVEPHNDFLWVAAEKGLPGLVAFGAMFVAAAWSLRRAIRAATASASAWLAVATLATLAGYVVLSCFDFPLDRISHQVVLALHLAVAAVLGHAAGPHPTRQRSLPAWFVLPPALAFLALGISYSGAAIRQERDVIASRRAARDGDWEGMLTAARRATTPWKTLDPLATPVAYLQGKAELQLGRLPEAIASLERAWEANPNRFYVLNDLGIAYAAADRFDDAIACFTIAANRYPDRLEPRQNLANCFADTGRFAEAVAVLEDVPESLRTAAMQASLARARERLAKPE